MRDPQYASLPPPPRPAPGTRASFLLGTDRHIMEGTSEQEQRVGVTPSQLMALRSWLAEAGITLQAAVVAGAGEAAGFTDAEYAAAGATPIDEAEIGSIDHAPDLVHALKEPCAYEAEVPGRFLRIGALHTGHFRPDAGLNALLLSARAVGIFDGSAVGNFSCRSGGGDAIPIRGSMSRFAGRAAAEMVLEASGTAEGGRCVVSGGGVVGTAAVERLLSRGWPGRITVIEASAARAASLRVMFAAAGNIDVVEADNIGPDGLSGAGSLICSAATPSGGAPGVVDAAGISAMQRSARVIDVSADEGCSIAGVHQDDVADLLRALPNAVIYSAGENLPRVYPREASEAHGNAVLPYIAVLLYLIARAGGPAGAVRRIIDVSETAQADPFHALMMDLRNGLAFVGPDPVEVNPKAVRAFQAYVDFLQNNGMYATKQQNAA